MVYGAQDLADSFRTVRKNTLQIAEDIPEDKYSFRATPDVQTVAEELAHIACSSMWQEQCHGVEKKTVVTFEDFGRYMGRGAELEKSLTTKAQIVDALRTNGESFATFLEGLSDAQLEEHSRLPAAHPAVDEVTLRDAVGGQGARDASSRQADAGAAAARHGAALDEAPAGGAGGAHGGGRALRLVRRVRLVGRVGDSADC